MREAYFTKDETVAMKGLMALMILLHHVYQHTLIGSHLEIFNYVIRSLGYIGVAGFFFISGYGLTVANKRSCGEYFKGFFKYRLLPLYLINVSLIILYAFFLFLLSDGFSIKPFVLSFAFGDSIVPAGWYLQELLHFTRYLF